jgi:hypothetical protein
MMQKMTDYLIILDSIIIRVIMEKKMTWMALIVAQVKTAF